MVEEVRLESVYTPKGDRGFESRPLREKYCRSIFLNIVQKRPNLTHLGVFCVQNEKKTHFRYRMNFSRIGISERICYSLTNVPA